MTLGQSQKISPPSWANTILNKMCPAHLREGIEGDLIEAFEANVQSVGLKRARWMYGWSVIRLIHPSIIQRNKTFIKIINMGLIRSHFVVAWRSMLKNRFYSLINVLGLSMAVTFVFISYLFIHNELSYDNFHENKNLIYRLRTVNVDKESGEVIDREYDAITSIPLAPDLASSIPEIKRFARYGSNSGTIVRDNEPYDEVFAMVDPGFLELFSFPMIAGQKGTALDDPGAVVISKEIAAKYFEHLDPIGQPLDITLNDSMKTFYVSGVVDNKDNISSIKFDFLLPFDRFEMVVGDRLLKSYHVAFIESYIEFAKPPDPSIVDKLSSAIADNVDSRRYNTRVLIQPFEEIHLDAEIVGNAAYTDPQKLWIMAGLALLVLIIATINFITLSTGHALKRIKEIGLRKTLGAFKTTIRAQLVLESFLVALMAGAIGLMATKALIPTFNNLIDASISFSLESAHLLFFLFMICLISLISGGLQSVILVKYTPVQALKGIRMFSSKESWLNQSLIILQFAFSIMLVIGTFVMRGQMHYIQNMDLGFDEERLVQINMQASDDQEASSRLLDRFKTEALADPQILSVGASMNSFNDPWTELSFRQVDESSENIYYNQIDPDYLMTMDLEVVMGEQFREDVNNSAVAIMVNETLVKHFEWEDPLNAQIPGKNFEDPHRIIGVVEDFHFSSLHHTIEPLVLALRDQPIRSGITGLSTHVWPSNLYQILVRIGPGNLKQAIGLLEDSWNKVNPNKAFTYEFVDTILAQNYEEEARWRKIIDTASVFAIVIAWMGLLGLTRLSVQKRIKEIGIRKVMGSSSWSVTALLSKRFLILVLVAMMIAIPVSWITMEKWLMSFSYRIDLNLFVFLAAGFLVLMLSMVSVGLQSIKVATSNPVNSLRYE